MEIIFIILLLFLSWFNYRVHRKIMAPAVLFSFVWTAVLFFQQVFKYTVLKDLYALNLNTLLLFTGGVIGFSLGSLIYYRANYRQVPVKREEVPINIPPLSFLFRLVLVGICTITLPFFIQKAFMIFLQSEVDNFLVGLRYEIVVKEADYGPLKYMITISIVVYALCQMEALRERSARNRLLALCSFLIAFAFAVFSSGRTFFLLLGTIFLGLQVILNPSFKIKRLFWIIPLFVLLFSGYGLLFGKGGNTEDKAIDLISSSSQFTALYMAGSLNAVDYELNHQFEPANNGQNSLRFFYVAGTALGIIGPVKFNDNLVQDYVLIPYPINVFTFYSPYLRDFGFAYPIAILFLLGLFQTFLYDKAIAKGSSRCALYFSIFLYPLVMSFFQDQYFSLLSTWIQCFVMVEAMLFLNLLFIKKSVIKSFPVKGEESIWIDHAAK